MLKKLTKSLPILIHHQKKKKNPNFSPGRHLNKTKQSLLLQNQGNNQNRHYHPLSISPTASHFTA